MSIHDTDSGLSRQYHLLSLEKQGSIDGTFEPLIISSNISANNSVESCKDNKNQKDLFVIDRQIELPIRPDIVHKNSEDCLRGYYAAICPNHSKEYKVHPLNCGKVQCNSSVEYVGNRRSKRVWNGNARKEDIGLKHFGSIPWAYIVITCPKQYQYLLAEKDGIKKFRKISSDVAIWAVKNNGLRQDSKVYAVSQSHACGDSDLEEYFLHENVIIPLIGINDGGKINKARHYLAKNMLEKVRAEIARRFSEEFGVTIEPNFHYQLIDDEAKKRHVTKYVLRNLLWNQVDDYRLKTRHLGLCNRKNKVLLKQLVCHINEVLEPWSKCKHSTQENPCPEKLFITGKSGVELALKLGNRGIVQSTGYPEESSHRRNQGKRQIWNRHSWAGLDPPD